MTQLIFASERPERCAYCTYFDSNYLSRGIVMISTLLTRNPDAIVHVLCLDDAAKRILDAWFTARVRTISLGEVHAFDPRLPALRGTRSTWAFYATHKAAFASYVMRRMGSFEWVVFIDADCAFYDSLAPVIDELGSASIGLSPHRFYDPNDERRAYGLYNAGFICFRDDPVGRQCLDDWRDDCVRWCHESAMADGRYMNQGYLSRWPERYANVAVIRHPGANLAPWNLRAHRIAVTDGRATVDGFPLIFYHFSSLVRHADGSWYSSYSEDLEPVSQLMAMLYPPYLDEVKAAAQRLTDLFGISGTGSVREDPAPQNGAP